MFIITDTTIQITRGDSGYFDITLLNADGSTYAMQEGDVLEFTVKKNTKTEEVLIHKTGQNIEILPADTKNLKYGTYTYDVQFTSAVGLVDTVITPSAFIVAEEVTF